MKIKIIFVALIILIAGCTSSRKIKNIPGNQFPNMSGKVKEMPSKENLYVFISAGQSNMAGRGIVEPEDTVSSPNVLTLNKDNEWIYAREPLHYYEPARTGLDCGLSFGKELLRVYGNNVTIGLVPCAVGGSSIEQWLGDSTHRDVKLYSNFLIKAKTAAESGTIKGVLWHQGENNATPTGYNNYQQNLKTFFEKMRNDLNDPGLPFYAGELGSYLRISDYPNKDSVNKDLQILSISMSNMYLIKTSDLTPMEDTVHFNSGSQRLMGERFARAVYKNKK